MTKESVPLDISGSVDPALRNLAKALLPEMIKQLSQARKRGHVYGALERWMRMARELKEAGSSKPSGQPTAGNRVYVGGVELERAVSVDEAAMTVTVMAVGDDGGGFVNPVTGEVVCEVVAARREIRIVRG